MCRSIRHVVRIEHHEAFLVVVSRNIEMKVHQRPINYQDEHREMIRLLEEKNSREIKELVMHHIKADWAYFETCSAPMKNDL